MKTAVFLDGNYLFYCAKDIDITIDYDNLVDSLLGNNDEVLFAKFYTGIEDPCNENQQRFLKWMNHNGYRVGTKPIKINPEGVKSCNLRSNMSADICFTHGSWDKVLIIGGDEDFAYAAKRVRGIGKRVEVAAFQASLSSRLKFECDKFIPLDEMAIMFTKAIS